MTVAAIIQARVGSTRLPAKVLADLEGAPVLRRVIDRVRRASHIDTVVIAAPDGPGDDALEPLARDAGVICIRGSETDVLGRYLKAAGQLNAGVIVRITADCPLIDPDVIDRVAEAFLSRQPAVDYCSNVIRRTFPRGLDVEVVSRRALEEAAVAATAPHHREHVTAWFYEQTGRVRLHSVELEGSENWSHLRWVVDEPADLEMARALYRRLPADGSWGWRAALNVVQMHPEIAAINAGIEQKPIGGPAR